MGQLERKRGCLGSVSPLWICTGVSPGWETQGTVLTWLGHLPASCCCCGNLDPHTEMFSLGDSQGCTEPKERGWDGTNPKLPELVAPVQDQKLAGSKRVQKQPECKQQTPGRWVCDRNLDLRGHMYSEGCVCSLIGLGNRLSTLARHSCSCVIVHCHFCFTGTARAVSCSC